MKTTGKLIIFIFTLLTLAANAYALSPREELQQMVEQLQKTPSDNALREKLIKLASEMKPAPAIPENAREPFVMGATVLKKASDPAGAGKAVDLFNQALYVAPWFADAYYNRAIARETAGQFELAIDDLKLYLNFKLTEAERREAQDKIYSLKADAQLGSAKKAEQDKIASAEGAKRQAQQAKRDVITQIKNVVGNRSYASKPLSYNGEVKGIFVGVSQRDLFGNGNYYMHDGSVNITWKFFDERVELWGRWGKYNDGEAYLICVGESLGQSIKSMRWYWPPNRPVWGHFDLSNGYFYLANVLTSKPLNDSEVDPEKRYQTDLFKPY